MPDHKQFLFASTGAPARLLHDSAAPRDRRFAFRSRMRGSLRSAGVGKTQQSLNKICLQ
jgi:hypothetical protein